MRLLILPLLAAAFVRPQDAKQSSYYPLKVGSKWEYKAGETKLVATVTKHEKVGDVMCAVVETSVDGKTAGTEHIAVTAEAICRFKYNDTEVKPGMPFLKLPPKKGDTWKVDCKFELQGTTYSITGSGTVGEAEIEVPAGKFKSVTSTMEYGLNGEAQGSFVYYFADGVGIVRLISKKGDQETVIDLQKYTPASK